nr:hypothetical protein CFP56_52508 [Quercus suber]
MTYKSETIINLEIVLHGRLAVRGIYERRIDMKAVVLLLWSIWTFMEQEKCIAYLSCLVHSLPIVIQGQVITIIGFRHTKVVPESGMRHLRLVDLNEDCGLRFRMLSSCAFACRCMVCERIWDMERERAMADLNVGEIDLPVYNNNGRDAKKLLTSSVFFCSQRLTVWMGFKLRICVGRYRGTLHHASEPTRDMRR